MKGYYCGIDRKPPAGTSAYLRLFAHEFCLEGSYYRAGDAVNFAIGQGDTLVTPLQLARAYAALSNGGTLFEPRIAKAIVSPDGTVVRRIPPKVQAHDSDPAHAISYVTNALLGTAKTGTMAWKMIGFPLDRIHIRSKTGSAEVYGKQSTSWVASYDDNYVVLMMVTQGGTGSGTSGPFVRKIWESLYGVHGSQVSPRNALIPGVVAPDALPSFRPDGSILPPAPRSRGRSQP
jgi:penicillin-binding protein 2